MVSFRGVKPIAIAVGLLFVWQSAFAQKSKLTGSVVDAHSGEPLIGATVIAETNGNTTTGRSGAKTNIEGKFTITLEAGSYAVGVSYLGYTTKRVEGVAVKPGEVKHVELTLEEKALTGSDIVVTAQVETETAAAQLVERKKASTMNDVMGAEQIRRSPDANSADAIKRMPGVTISGSKFVNIRGANERYNNALLNGGSLASSEPDKKAFSFDLLPSNLIDHVTVSKTFTPDLPGSFSGGLVQISTVNFPEQLLAKLSIGTSTMSTTTGNTFATYQTGSKDWLATDDGIRALPGEVPSTTLNDTLSNARRTEISQSFKNTWAPSPVKAPLNTNFALSLGGTFPVFENDFGVVGSLSYRNGYDHSDIMRSTRDPGGLLQVQRNGTKDVRSVLWGGLLNLSYKLSETDIISLKNMCDRSADDQVILMTGVDSTDNGKLELLGNFHYTERSLFSNQLTGDHVLENLGKMGIHWQLSRSASTRSEPDLRGYEYKRETPEDVWYYAPSKGFTGRFYSDLAEQLNEGILDLTFPLGDGSSQSKLKTGGLLSSKTRVFSARDFEMFNAGSDFRLGFIPIDSIFAEQNIDSNGFLVNELTNPTDRYDAAEHIATAYAMFDLPFTLFNGKFRTVGGLRYEHAEQDLNSVLLGGRPINYARVHDDILPALTLIYSLSDQANIRAAWSNTVSRPEFREIAPFTFTDFEYQQTIQGDTNIDRVLIRNLDLRAEYYPTAGELVSLSLFHKRFGLANELFGLLYKHFDGGAIEETNDGANNVVSWRNASKSAVNYGWEIEIRKNLGFISEYCANIVLTGNYANIISVVNVHDLSHGLKEERPMEGQAPFTLNLGINFTEPSLGTTFSALYNRIGKRIVEVNYVTDDLYEMPRSVIDLSLTQTIGSLELRYSAKDILAQEQEFISGNYVLRTNRRGATHSVSVSYKF